MKKNLSNLSSGNALQKSTPDFMIDLKKNDKFTKKSSESTIKTYNLPIKNNLINNYDIKFDQILKIPKPNKFHIKPILTDQRNDTQFNNTLPNDILTNNSQTNYTQPNYTQPNHTHHSDSRIPASKGKLTFSL